jgi:hypothetical protein
MKQYVRDERSTPPRAAKDYTPLTTEELQTSTLYGNDFYYERLLMTPEFALIQSPSNKEAFMKGAMTAVMRVVNPLQAANDKDEKELQAALNNEREKLVTIATILSDALHGD